ncbi:MAG: hypothetical protein HQK60_19700 [Deltaproteobacteria bacterium]|nr:hypothetical protein [Deltaproteobacteria bacterium]
MLTICDTCSTMMVIRIAPQMYTGEPYECETLIEIRHEILRTQKFKEKYPWRKEFKDKIHALSDTQVNTGGFKNYLDVMQILLKNITIDEATGKAFNLSQVDQKILARALDKQAAICTGDKGLIRFAKQEFEFTNIISSLGLVNIWLRKGLIQLNDVRLVFDDWKKLGEASQPQEDIKAFEKLTRMKYSGV